MSISAKYEHFRFSARKLSYYKISPYHIGRHGRATRYYRGSGEWTPTNNGGYTICLIIDDDSDSELAFGVAECSKDDQFSYAVGRGIAFTRALVSYLGVVQ